MAARALALNETERRDARLARMLASSSRALEAEAARARAWSQDAARSPTLQRRIAARDAAGIRRLLLRAPQPTAVYVRRRLVAGTVPAIALRRSVALRGTSDVVASLVIFVPLNRSLLERAAKRAGADTRTILAIASGRRIVAATTPLPTARLTVPIGQPDTRTLANGRYRVLGVPLARDSSSLVLVGLSPLATDGWAGRRRRILIAAAVSAATAVLLLSLLVPLLRGRRQPPPAERRRRVGDRAPTLRGKNAREALGLVGDALAATHNPDSLMPVILEAAIEATGAIGGRIVRGGIDVAHAGQTTGGTSPFVAALDDDSGTKLVLVPPVAGFDPEARELGVWLAAQAAIALENARLHTLVKTQATTDELTGLANRRRFIEALSLELKRAHRFDSPLGVILADIDDFKLVNDRFGHRVGDSVLCELGRVFQETLRDVDVPARIGGEEFAVLLPATDAQGAQDVSERLRVALAGVKLDDPEGGPLHVTASFGFAVYPPAQSADELLASADAALYRAKHQGKNRVAYAGEGA